jgi:iron complex outermembrane receptor protein
MTVDPACGTTDAQTGATSFPTAVPYNCGYFYTQFTNYIEPQERLNIFGQFNLEISDRHEVYGHVLYTNNDSLYTASPTYPPTNPDAAWWWFAPPGTSHSTSPSYYVPPHNPGLADYVSTLPADQQINFAYGAYFTGRTIAIAGLSRWGKLTQEWPRRQQTWQLLGGLRGEWGSGPKAVHYDFAATYGTTEGQIDGHDILNDRWAAANWGYGGPDCDAENGTPGVAPCYFWNNNYTGFTSSDPALQNREDVFNWMLGDTGSKYGFSQMAVYMNFSGATGAELGGGPLTWAAGYEYNRSEDFLTPVGQSYTDSIFDENPFGFLWLVFPFGVPDPVDTDSHAAYAELLLPFADTFEIGLAARYTNVPWLDESYTKGKVAARWTPVPQLVLRGSFSQGLIIPSPWQLDRWDRYVANVGAGNFVPIEVPPANATGGLVSEEADSVNFGFVWHPVPQVTITADYWQIDFTDPIVREGPGYVLANKPEQVEFTPSGLAGRVYTHTINGPDLDARGYDFGFNWDIPSSAGLFSLGFDGAILDKYLFAADEGLGFDEFDALGDINGRFGNGPVVVYATPELKYNAYVGWQKGRHSLNVMYHHVDGYANTRVDPTYAPPTPELGQVDDFNTYDVYYALRIPSWHTTFRISVLNAGDEDPPIVWEELAYDAMTHNPMGRRVKVGVSYQF